jgi:transposase InsO family protein
MPVESPVADVAHVIQLSVAPVFLLTAVGTILGVLSTRLGRIVDRYRLVGERSEAAAPDRRARLEAELALLLRRRRLVQLAITCGTATALMVCTVIATAFLGYIFGWKVSGALAVLFIVAMGFFVGALVLFLAEVLIAVGTVHVEGR